MIDIEPLKVRGIPKQEILFSLKYWNGRLFNKNDVMPKKKIIGIIMQLYDQLSVYY